MKFHSQIKKLPAEGRQCSELYIRNIVFSVSLSRQNSNLWYSSLPFILLVIWSYVKVIGLKKTWEQTVQKKENQLEFFFLLILILLYKYFRLYDYFLHRWYHGKRRSKPPLRCHIMLKCTLGNQNWKFTKFRVKTLKFKGT